MEDKMTNFKWYLANQAYLADLYEGMYAVIKDCSVIATFWDKEEAYAWRLRKFPNDNEVEVQWCMHGERAYTIDQY